jgi:hypothetical protein
MRITITLPDEIAERVCRLPDRDEFVARAVEEAFAREPQKTVQSGARPSKWAQIVERIDNRSASLGDYEAKLAADRREFRRSFRFKHDEP